MQELQGIAGSINGRFVVAFKYTAFIKLLLSHTAGDVELVVVSNSFSSNAK